MNEKTIENIRKNKEKGDFITTLIIDGGLLFLLLFLLFGIYLDWNKNKRGKETELVFALDGFEHIYNNIDDKESELISDLFSQYDDSDSEKLKIIISGQRINQMSIISNIQENIATYQYIDFQQTLEADGKTYYKRMNQLENIARAVERSKVYKKQ